MSHSKLLNLLVAVMVFVLPLAGAPSRLGHPGPWLGLAACFVILVTQPPLEPKRMVADRGDRLSGLAIFASVIGSQAVAVAEFGYRTALQPEALSAAVFGGAVLIAGGLALRIWAIRTLGRFFTSTVEVQEAHRVVDWGPYRLLRHPSYTGTLIAALGVTLTLASVSGAVLVLGVVLPAYLYRIHVEERALVHGIGEPYRVYRTSTWRLVPFLY